MFFSIFQNFGPRATVIAIGWMRALLCPIAGLDAWCGTMLNGHRAIAWARAAFFCALSLGGLYLALSPETIVGIIER